MYGAIIIGSGSAGLFATYELITQNRKLKVALIDRESMVAKRLRSK